MILLFTQVLFTAMIFPAISLLSLTGASEGTISMQEGEVLAVVEEDKGDGWTRVRRNNGDEGYIPTSYVAISLNKWKDWRGRENRKDDFIKLCAVLPMGPIKRKPEHDGRDHWCIQKGIWQKCFELLREVPQMGRGTLLTGCSSCRTLQYCSTSYLKHKKLFYFTISCQRLFFFFFLE